MPARFNRPLAVIMADLDHFKRINDTYGHLAGDTVLQGLGTIIRTTIRQYDLAGRFGGEELALVLPETGPAAALALAERLRRAVEAARLEVPSSPTPVHATLSLGVACFPADATTFPELLHAADVSVYQAKLGGRNRVVGAAGVPRVITREAAATVDSPEVGAAVAGAPATHAAGDQARRTGETGVSVRAGSRPAGKHPAACDATPGHEFARVGDIQLRSAEDAGQDGAASAPARGPHSLLRLFVGGVIVAALGMTALCIAQGVRPEPTTLGVLTGLAALLELLPVDVYGRNTVSVSVAVAFAAALTSGTPGVAVVGAAIALVHYLRRRPALYKAAFNWAAHLLAGAAPALITRAAGLPVDLAHLPLLAVPTIVGALAYYALDTGLIAAAISLSSGARLLPTWRLQFQWLAGHYLGLCVMGLFLAIAATALGPAGIVVFALPVLMMRLAQQQYVAQTQDSVRELERMNGELARANEEIIATSRAERARLERAALTDSLTELGNHRAFQEALHRESGRARRQGETVTLARLDIDEFKQLNDQHGHGQGDRVLAELAAVLRGNRAADQAFRLGGDEFALLLPHTSRPEAVMVMERLRQDARRRLFGATVSVGVAALEPGSHDVDTLQEQAEAALYEAKRRGRDAVVTFAEVQDCVSILSPAKVQAVRRLLAEGHVRVAFQPIWDLQRGGIVAFEALARPAPDYGFAGPQEAFDIAERIGHAHDLDVVCRQAILARAAELPPDTLLFLNVSPQTLDHGLLAGTTLAEAVTAAGLTPERVVLELTERSLARLQVVVREAARLRSLGFKLALDDTGAGNAGLEMLSQVPVDVVKIDRGVVVKALTDRAARGVLAGIIAIARETDTYVIAEGIEDQAMLDVVRRVGVRAGSVQDGVHGVQGYLLGRPSEAIPAPTAVETYRTFLRAA